MKNNGSPPPIFKTDEDRTYFLVTLPIHPNFHDEKKDKIPTDESWEKVGKRLGKGWEKTGKNEKIILKCILKNPDITIQELAEKIDISTTAVENNIKKLKKKNLIKRVGTRKEGHWEIILD